MKVLFLDVDGVLNSRNSTDFKNKLWPVDNYMCFLVGKIQLYTKCSIVVSSSWRHHPDGMKLLEERFVNVIGKTPSSELVEYDDKPRGMEIQAWLDKHPEVEKYAILDDDSDMLENQLPNFFKTTFESGLTEEIAEKVIEHLGKEKLNDYTHTKK